MKELPKVPQWAFEKASAKHRQRALDAHQKGFLQITWPDPKSLKTWAKQQGWPVPWFNFQKHFIHKMFESDANFAQVLKNSGLRVSIPLEYYKVPEKTIQKWDALYNEREDMGILGMRPVRWGHLVEDLREIRRIIEVGVVVEVGAIKIKNFDEFMSWVDKHYHALEDGYDSWVGDDRS